MKKAERTLGTKAIRINRIKDLYWKESFTVEEIAKKLGFSPWSVYGFMRRNNIPRRSFSEANYVFYSDMPQFKIKEKLSAAEEQLKTAGLMLYWAEGTLLGSTVDLANSNPQIIRLFLNFLRDICGVDNRRLRIYLYAYSYQDMNKLKSYWSTITGVPLAQFTKPYVRIGNPNVSGRKLLYGLVHVRYNDKKLLDTIRKWVHDYTVEICGEVPKRSNGSDCGYAASVGNRG